MIKIEEGQIHDIFADSVQAYVNPVNCVGVAGKGLALTFKTLYPRQFQAYANICKAGKLNPGDVLLQEVPNHVHLKWIICFPTKHHWRNASRIEDIEAGLHSLSAVIKKNHIRSISIPALGCGLGGLPWSEVRPLMGSVLGHLEDVIVILHAPKEQS